MDLNQVTLMGNLGKDPVLRVNEKTGKETVRFRLCTNEYWRNKQSGELESKECWHNIVVAGPSTQRAMEQLKKGMNVYVQGKIENWQDKEGKTVTDIAVMAFKINKASGAQSAYSDQGSSSNSGSDQNNAPYVEDDVPF